MVARNLMVSPIVPFGRTCPELEAFLGPFGWREPRITPRIPAVRLSFPCRVLVLLISLTAVSCASSFELTADEQSMLRDAMDTPLTFVVPRGEAIPTWDRAQEFIDRYSSMKLRSVNDSLITTYENVAMVTNPIETASSVRFGYTVSRARDPEGIRFQVGCTPSSRGPLHQDRNGGLQELRHPLAASLTSGAPPLPGPRGRGRGPPAVRRSARSLPRSGHR